MNFLYFLAYIFKKNMTFATSADKSETKKKNGFKNNILPLVCDNRNIIVNLIKNTNKKTKLCTVN